MTDDELIDNVVREARVIFAQMGGFRITGLAAEDLPALIEFDLFYELNAAQWQAVFESSLAYRAPLLQVVNGYGREVDAAAVAVVMHAIAGFFAYFMQYSGRVRSASSWRAGRGAGLQVILEKRDEVPRQA